MHGLSIQVSKLKVGGRQLFPNGIRINIPAGQPNLLLGPNGCGKSVLFTYLAGWGEIIDDVDIQGEFALHEQHFRVPSDSKEFKIFARKEIIFLSHRLNEEKLGVTFGEEMDLILAHFEEGIPPLISDAFSTLRAQISIQQEVDTLAAGHRQLLAFLDVVGRARTCQAVLLDEPTSFLGDKLIPIMVLLIEWLITQNPTCAILIATHDGRLMQQYPNKINISEQLPKARPIIDLAPLNRIYSRNKPVTSAIRLDAFSKDQAKRYPRFTATLSCEESLLVTGPSGAGKTTFLKTCGGLRRIQGTLKYHDEKGRKISKRELYPRYLSYLFQTPEDHEFRGQVASILRPPAWLPEEDVKLYSQFIANFLDAYSISEQQNPRTLSSGQLRMVWVVSQFIWGGRWLLDEPDAALDENSRCLLLSLLSLHLRHGGTIIIVTHNPAVFDALNLPNLQLAIFSST